jgi:hypothetical protein
VRVTASCWRNWSFALRAALNLFAPGSDKSQKAWNPAADHSVFRSVIRERRPMLSRITQFDPYALEIFVCGIVVGTLLVYAL